MTPEQLKVGEFYRFRNGTECYLAAVFPIDPWDPNSREQFLACCRTNVGTFELYLNLDGTHVDEGEQDGYDIVSKSFPPVVVDFRVQLYRNFETGETKLVSHDVQYARHVDTLGWLMIGDQQFRITD